MKAYRHHAYIAAFAALMLLGAPGAAMADCTSPAGIAGRITWNGTDSVIWCDGTSWYALKNAAGAAGSTGEVQFNGGAGAFSTDAGLTWDNTNKRLGVGTNTPSALMELASNGGTGAGFWFTMAANSGNEPILLGQRSRGTLSAKTAITSGQHLLRLLGRGYDGTSAYTGGGSILITASETYSPTTGAAYIAFQTTPTGSTTQSERVRIDSAGNVGIGTTSPATPLHVNGNITAAAYLYSSDRRLKTDIEPLTGQLAKIAALEPVSYTLKADTKRALHLGLIAQDAETIYPEVVQGKGDAMKSIDYAALVGPLIAAVKELKAASDNQSAVNEAQASEIKLLKAQLESLRRVSPDP